MQSHTAGCWRVAALLTVPSTAWRGHMTYAGTQGSHASESADDWVIVDSVRAPSTRGAYVLRWYAAAMSYLSIGLAATCSNASRWLSRSDALTSSDRSSRLTELTSWLSVCWLVLYKQALGHGAEPTSLDQLCGYRGRVMDRFIRFMCLTG